MTKYKIDWSKYNPIPDFDGLKWKDEVQTQIYEETKNMSRAEVREYFRRKSENFDRKIAELQRQMKIEAGE